MEFANLLINLFVILVTAKLFGEAAHRMGQSPVVGELVGGIVVGSSVLGLVHETIPLAYLAELGAIFLLFEVGVSSHLYKFLKLGFWALIVAVIGVAVPFISGFYVCLYFGLDQVHSIFVGAILTATSVGITARVFTDLKKLATQEAQIVLGAAVIDDVIGLGILAVVTKLVETGSVSVNGIAGITGYAVLFLAGSLLIGALTAPFMFRVINGMKVAGAVIVGAFSFCLLMSFLAAKVGLAPIVGAFSAGLILSITDSKEHIEAQIKPVVDIFVPVFFVLMGSHVDIRIFNPFISSNLIILQLSGSLLIAAIIGKVMSGYGVLKKGVNRLLIGVGMIPRGEVGLIFAGMGLTSGIISKSIYSAAVIVIITTTFLTPFILKAMLKEDENK